ncbi:MAG TPA: phosphotransferase family protein [Candidatus Acidoferrales bacterium]|nr:phosphotransferase family protein [Candidatus Acidoferrales bacterium]
MTDQARSPFDGPMRDFWDRPDKVRAGEELDLAKLEPFLRSRLPDSAGPLVVQQFSSGHSNLTYLVRLGDREMVLRRPPFGSKVKSAHDVGREYRVLSKLHPAYRAAPKTLLYCPDESVLGAPFYVMEPIRGVILRKDPPAGLPIAPETLRGLSESFLDNLVTLHSLDYEAIGLGDLGRPQGYLERQVRGWIERYSGSQTHDLPEVERIAAWLRERMPAQSGAALIHNDYKYDNVVLDPADITSIKGVLDWEMCTVGDPLADLGTATAYWVNPDDPDELQQIRWGPTALPGSLTRAGLVQRYAEQTGRDTSDMVFYYVFGLFKTAIIVQQIYYRYHHGLTKDARFASLLEVTRILLRAALRPARTGHV